MQHPTGSRTSRRRLVHWLAPLILLAALPSHSLAAASPATWTTGHKRVLIIPIAFPDQAGPNDTPNSSGYRSGWGNITNGTTPAALNEFFQRASYGKLSLEFTVLPEINLGVSYTTYNAPYGTTGLTKFAAWDEPGSLADDVRAKARLAGQLAGQAARYDTDNYDLDIIIAGFIPGQGTLASGRTFGKGIFGTTTLALAHELCHNFGLQHANGISRSTFYSPLKGGTFFTDTYGDVYDLMGWKNTGPIPLVPDRDPNPFWKNLISWLPDANIVTPAGSGLYRIHAFDQPVLEGGRNYALRIVRDPLRTYWFSYRQSITNVESIWSRNGLEVRIGGESVPATAGHTTLLDMTPGSRGLASAPGLTNSPYASLYDAPLAIGRTYTDAAANLHVTPIKKGGTIPESLDVVVNYGPFPGNNAPIVSITPATLSLAAGVPQTFTATASDPDGDELSYYWEFDDPDALGGNAAGNTNPDARLSIQGSHTWTRNGQHLVRCTVSDMKGRTTIATAIVTITGGSPAFLTVTGVVKDENGNPLAGAVVNNYKGSSPNLIRYGATNFVGSSETGADGRYTVLIPAGATGTNFLTVLHQGYNFTCSTLNGAIKVSPTNVTDVDFTRVRTNRTISGGIYVAGRGYDPAVDGALNITFGGQTVAASAGSWSTTVPDGAPLQLTATPSNPAYTVVPFAPNPYFVANDFNLMHLFVNIPGRMPQVGFTTNGMTSDDTVGTVNIPVTLSPPAGSNSWPANQAIYYWVDPSSTAEYGVDYKMAGGGMTFPGGQVPTPQTIPLKIIPTGAPKSKTVVIRLGPATSIANVGPANIFTYTITNPPAPPLNHGSVQFAQAAYSVAESAGSITLSVQRSGGTDGAISVNYATANGTALAPGDFTATNGILNWLAGDATAKSITIPISDDSIVEPAEAFTVTLSNPLGGATIGTPATATVTITDDDVVIPENHAPVLPPNAVFTILKLTELVVTNTATDSDLPAQTLTYELLTKPAVATIDANGIVRWTPSTASTNFFQTRVTDNGVPARSATNNFYVIVTEPLPPAENHAPILPRPTVVTVVKLTEMVFTNSATDIDLPPQTLTYELLANPTGATIDANGIVRWTPSALQSPSTNRFRVKITDSGLPARSATNVFYAIVTEGNTAPHLFGPSSLILSNNASFAESFRATDSDAPANHLTFQLISGPDWVSFTQTDATQARLAGTPPTVTTDTSFTVVLQVSDDGSPPLSSRLSLRLYLRPTAPPCAVARQLPVGYVPGTSLTITLRANPGDGTTSFTVADAPPAGWTIGAISDAGQFDTPSGTVRFGPFTDATPRTLTYAVTPPLTETGPKTFAGIVARNGIYTGVCGYDVLPPLNNHPADSSPANLRLTAAEVSAYAAAWKTGTPWPGSTNPINLAFVTRADYLQRNGETYTLNSAATPPLLWIPTPRAGLAARIPATTGTPVGKGCWRFLPHKLAVGVTATINLVVNPAPTDASYAIEETPPAGWTVANISHDGAYDSASGRIRWGLFSDGQPRTLTYELTPTGAFDPFTGIASFDGSTLPVAGASQPEVLPAISETEFAPATRLPSGEIVLPLATRVGTVTVIEISGDLRLWTPIWTNAPGAQIFRELPVNIPAGRFYRLVEQ